MARETIKLVSGRGSFTSVRFLPADVTYIGVSYGSVERYEVRLVDAPEVPLVGEWSGDGRQGTVVRVTNEILRAMPADHQAALRRAAKSVKRVSSPE